MASAVLKIKILSFFLFLSVSLSSSSISRSPSQTDLNHCWHSLSISSSLTSVGHATPPTTLSLSPSPTQSPPILSLLSLAHRSSPIPSLPQILVAHPLSKSDLSTAAHPLPHPPPIPSPLSLTHHRYVSLEIFEIFLYVGSFLSLLYLSGLSWNYC